MNRVTLNNVRPLAASVAATFIALFSTPSTTPLLARRLIDQCGRGSQIQSSPIVVVGVLTSDELVFRPVPMRSDPTYPLQLRRLKIRVENVLKGASLPSIVGVYYFTFAAGFDGPRPLGLWGLGGRRIFGLRRDSGVFRTACDGWDSCTESLSSGAHPGYRPDPSNSLDYALLDLRLTRGEGPMNEIAFATEVRWEPGEPRLLAYALEKLRHLAITEHGEVKSSVCEMLRIYSVDRIDANLRRRASDALYVAHCQCATKPDGNVVCR